MKLNKAYKFRLYPNKDQELLINKTIGCTRFIYNLMLNDKIEYYKENKKTLDLTPAMYKKDHSFLREVDSLALANAQLNLQKSFKNFFKLIKKKELKKSVTRKLKNKEITLNDITLKDYKGYPRFKSKHKNKLSYTTNKVSKFNIHIQGNKIKLPKLKYVKFKKHREIEGKIKSCTISLSRTGKYYISVLVEYHKDIKQIPSDNNIIALDFSMKDLFHSSENTKAKYPRYYRKSLEKLKLEQRRLSRKVKGSKNRNKQKLKLNKIHEKISNQRKDFLHKLSRSLANNYNIVIIEDLNMKSMSQCLNFGKAVIDNGWGMFRSMLYYKLELEGKQLIIIDKWFPSSKKCSSCGNVKEDLKLSDRSYKCDHCNLEIDRDYNASLNIKEEGTSLLAW